MPDFGRWTANGGDPSLNDINRADKFLDALATEQPPFSTDRGDADLAFLLAGWRDEVRQVPMDHVATTDAAAAALVDATAGPSRRNRLSLAVVGSAAAAVLCLGGFGTAVFAAGPGDGLYGVRTMLFGDERATRDDAVVLAAQTELAQVQQLVDQGQWDQAQDKLAALSATVQSVDQVEQKQELIQQWNALTYKVVEQDPAAALPPPGEPLPALPASPLTLLPIPVIDATDTVTTTTPDTPSTTVPVTTPAETTGPEVLSTTEPSATTTPSSTVTDTSATATTTPATAAPTTTAPSSTTAPTTTAPPSSTTTTTAAPSTATTTAVATTTSAAPTTTTTTTTVTQSSAAAPSVEEPAVREPVVEEPAAQETAVPQETQAAEPTRDQPAESAPPVVTTTTMVPVPSDDEE